MQEIDLKHDFISEICFGSSKCKAQLLRLRKRLLPLEKNLTWTEWCCSHYHSKEIKRKQCINHTPDISSFVPIPAFPGMKDFCLIHGVVARVATFPREKGKVNTSPLSDSSCQTLVIRNSHEWIVIPATAQTPYQSIQWAT